MINMSNIKRIGAPKAGASLPFSKAVQADGWLYVSGQVPAKDGDLVSGSIVPQAHQAIQNMLAIVEEAGYSKADIVRCGVWLDDTRDFGAFNKVYAEYFAGPDAPARACVQAMMVVDCKVEIDCVCYKAE